MGSLGKEIPWPVETFVPSAGAWPGLGPPKRPWCLIPPVCPSRLCVVYSVLRCGDLSDLRARFGGSIGSRTGSLLLGLDRLADQEGPVIGLDASHLPLLVDGRADSSCRSGGFPELDDDRQQRLLQLLGIGVQHDQAVQDPLPQRLAGKVCLLVPGPGAGRRPTCRKQDPREVSGSNPVHRRVVGLGSWHVGNAPSCSKVDHDQRQLPTILSRPAPTCNPTESTTQRVFLDRLNISTCTRVCTILKGAVIKMRVVPPSSGVRASMTTVSGSSVASLSTSTIPGALDAEALERRTRQIGRELFERIGRGPSP